MEMFPRITGPLWGESTSHWWIPLKKGKYDGAFMLFWVLAWINVELLSIGPLGTNFNRIRIETQNFSFKEMPLKMLSAKCQPIVQGGDELILGYQISKHNNLISSPNTFWAQILWISQE